MRRRDLLLSLALSLVATVNANAQVWPARPIKLIVPYAPGGSADIVARMVTEEWAKALGGVMVVDNRAGAGGNLGGMLFGFLFKSTSVTYVEAFTYIGYTVIAVSVVVLITRFQKQTVPDNQPEKNQLVGAL